MKKSPMLDILVGAALSKKKDKPAEDMEEEDTEDSEMGLDQAADEMMAAIDSGDTKAFVKALKAFIEQC